MVVYNVGAGFKPAPTNKHHNRFQYMSLREKMNVISFFYITFETNNTHICHLIQIYTIAEQFA